MDSGTEILNYLTKAGIDVAELGIKTTAGALKISGKMALEIMKILLEHQLKKQAVLKSGETNLAKLINSGQELKMTEINKKDLKGFTKRAKNYGITYAVIRDKGKFSIVYTNRDIDRVKAVFESVIASRVNPIKKLVGKVKESLKKQQVNILRKIQGIVEKKLEKMQPQQDVEPVDVQNKEESITSHNSQNRINEKNVNDKEKNPKKKESINEKLASINIEEINAKRNVDKTKNKVGRPKKVTEKTNASR